MTLVNLRGRLAPLLGFLLVATVYLLTIHSVYTWDGLWDAILMKEGVQRWPWSAAHPLADLLQNLAVRVAGAMEAPLRVMAAVNSLTCAAAVAVTFAGLRGATGRAEVAAGVALLLAASGAFWFYAGNIEAYGPGLLGASLVLAATVHYARRPGVGTAVLAGLALALGYLLHIGNSGLAAGLAVAWLRGSRRPVEAVAMAAAGLLPALAGLGLFLFALGLPVRPDGWDTWLRISVGPNRDGLWLPDPLWALGRLPYLVAGARDPSFEVIKREHAMGLLAWSVLLGAVGWVLWTARRRGGDPSLRLPLLAALSGQLLVFCLTDATNEYLTVVLLPAWWLAGVEAARVAGPRMGAGLMAAAALLAGLNLATEVLPNLQPTANPYLERTLSINRSLQPWNHLFVRRELPGSYLRFFAPCPVYMLHVERMSDEDVAGMRRLALRLVWEGFTVYMDGDLLDSIRSPDRGAPRARATFQGLRAVPPGDGVDPRLYRLEPASPGEPLESGGRP